jgi:DNA modification methylase
MFFYARKGNAELAWPGRSNVYVAPPVHPNHKRHPTERPVELIQDIIKTFSIENAQILVPFAGSGRTMIEAYKLKRTAIGYDLADVYRNAYIEAVEKEFQNA